MGANGAGKSTLIEVLARLIRLRGRTAGRSPRRLGLMWGTTEIPPDSTGDGTTFPPPPEPGHATAAIHDRFRWLWSCARAGVSYFALDEPTLGMDEGHRRLLGEFVRDLARSGRGVLLASHDTGFLESVCDSALWLDGGRRRAEGEARRVLEDYRASAGR